MKDIFSRRLVFLVAAVLACLNFSGVVEADDFQFLGINVTNNYCNTAFVPVKLNVTGNPSYIAISMDDKNYASDAIWDAYTSSDFTINLGSTEGWHEVWIGLKGNSPNEFPIWQWKRLKLDMTPPSLSITTPTSSTVSVPMIQIKGFCPEELAYISYDLTNALGLVTNQDAGITDRYYDTNTYTFTTNYFECVDVPLTNGVNIITLHASDRAGNVTTTNFSFTLDYSGATNPVVQLTMAAKRHGDLPKQFHAARFGG